MYAARGSAVFRILSNAFTVGRKKHSKNVSLAEDFAT
jgi:hypothetical protein